MEDNPSALLQGRVQAYPRQSCQTARPFPCGGAPQYHQL